MMTKRILMVAMAAAALALAGCNKEVDNAEVTTAADGAADTAAAPAPADAGQPAETSVAPETADTVATPAAPADADPAAAAAPAAPAGGEVTLPGGTKYVDEVVGTGAEAAPGNTVSVHYTGTLTNGTKFDSSVDRGTPFEFVLGQGRVIPGWEQGVAGMKVGGKRKLTIPPDQGYGQQAMGPIPPNSTLLFDVELVDVK